MRKVRGGPGGGGVVSHPNDHLVSDQEEEGKKRGVKNTFLTMWFMDDPLPTVHFFVRGYCIYYLRTEPKYLRMGK